MVDYETEWWTAAEEYAKKYPRFWNTLRGNLHLQGQHYAPDDLTMITPEDWVESEWDAYMDSLD